MTTKQAAPATPLISGDEYPMDALRRMGKASGQNLDFADFAIVRDELLHRGFVVQKLVAEREQLIDALRTLVDAGGCSLSIYRAARSEASYLLRQIEGEK